MPEFMTKRSPTSVITKAATRPFHR